MKQLLFCTICTIFIFLVPTKSYSQNTLHNDLLNIDHKPKLIEVYGQDYIDANPTLVDAYNEMFEFRLHYVESSINGEDKYPKLSEFPLMNKVNNGIVGITPGVFNQESFNPLWYNLPFFSNQTTVIRIDQTNWLLVIDPVKR